MGIVFDPQTALMYDRWYLSPQGRAVDRCLEHLVKNLLRPFADDRVLEVGCGSGHHLLMLARMGLRVAGVDASPYVIAQARARLGRGSEIEVARGEDLPFADNAFDLVVFINTLEFMDQPLAALTEAARVSRREVFVLVLNSLSWNGLVRATRACLGDPLFRHAHLLSPWQVRGLMRRAYGRAPIRSLCVSWCPAPQGTRPRHQDAGCRVTPFGHCLGLAARMTYPVRTVQTPLTAPLRPAADSG